MMTFEAVAKAAVGGSEMSDAYIVLTRIAWKLDNLRAEIAEDADLVAQKFAKYSRAMADGHLESCPSGWPQVGEIARNHAEFEVLVVTFNDLLHALTGKTAAQVRQTL